MWRCLYAESHKLVRPYRCVTWFHERKVVFQNVTFYICLIFRSFFPFLHRGFKLDPKEINDIAALYGHSLRKGTHDLLKLTYQLQVPVLVFSAGLGDTICAVLKNEQVFLPHIKVVSNYINYDENGFVNGFCPEYPLIHTFNKNESVLEGIH